MKISKFSVFLCAALLCFGFTMATADNAMALSTGFNFHGTVLGYDEFGGNNFPSVNAAGDVVAQRIFRNADKDLARAYNGPVEGSMVEGMLWIDYEADVRESSVRPGLFRGDVGEIMFDVETRNGDSIPFGLDANYFWFDPPGDSGFRMGFSGENEFPFSYGKDEIILNAFDEDEIIVTVKSWDPGSEGTGAYKDATPNTRYLFAFIIDDIREKPQALPEPATMLLLGLGLIGLAGISRKKFKK